MERARCCDESNEVPHLVCGVSFSRHVLIDGRCPDRTGRHDVLDGRCCCDSMGYPEDMAATHDWSSLRSVANRDSSTIMIRKFRPLLSILMFASYFAVGAEAAQQNPKSLADTPLDQCTPQTALGSAFADSVTREADNAPQAIRVTEKIDALVNELPPGKEKVPIGEQMTPEQSVRFAELSAQLLIFRYNHLAESRLQRDVRVIGWAVDAIEKLQAGASQLASKDDPGADGAALVGLLRKAGEGDSHDKLGPTSGNTCGLDFALYQKENASYASLQKHLGSKEAAEWKEIRAKYNVATGPLDPKMLPSPDREKAIWLLKAFGAPTQRSFEAVQDWQNLRRFASVSALKYSTERDAIITGAGSKDYDYDTNFKKAYSLADQVMKQTMDAWFVIDESVPSAAAKENAELVKISKGAKAGKN